VSKRNAIFDAFLGELGVLEGFAPERVIDGPLDHTIVRGEPVVFVVQLQEPGERSGSGGSKGRRSIRTLRVMVAYVMKIDDAKTAGSERTQLNAAYDPFHEGIEAINEREGTLMRVYEDEAGPWFVGFGDKDRRVATICYWHIPYTRDLGKPSN